MPFISSPSEIVGELDTSYAPLLEITFLVNSTRRLLPCHIDTGSQDTVVFTDINIALGIGLSFDLSPQAVRLERLLANNLPAYFLETSAVIEWFAPTPVTVLAPDPRTPPPPLPAPPTPTAHTSSARVLIGIPLLLGSTITIDFPPLHGRVHVTPPPQSYVRPFPL